MREIYNFNTEWLYLPEDSDGVSQRDFQDDHFEVVHVPHSNIELPHHYFSEAQYQFVSWYRRHFKAETAWQGQRVWVHFDGAMSVTEVYLNGVRLGENKGGYVPFAFDLTDHLLYNGEDNVLALRLDSSHRPDLPPEGDVVDYLLFGGLYRNVTIQVKNPISLENPYITNQLIEAKAQRALVQFQCEVRNDSLEPALMTLHANLYDQNRQLVGNSRLEVLVQPCEVTTVQLPSIVAEQPCLWDLNSPYLYVAELQIYKTDENSNHNQLLDQLEQKVGIRSVEYREDGKFYLNGTPLKLRGLNRHQMFPYVGQAMGKRMQQKDAEILKYELGLNFVRASHYPQDPSFLDRCDEIGLLVLEEIPGWQHIGDQNWKEVSCEHLTKMILRDRNHPSIFTWGVRINESPDDHDFFTTTNHIAHRLDPSRPRGGIRNFLASEFLENVFTYNDFYYNLEGKLTPPVHSPTLVTEYMGHMFPTRRYDNDTRLLEHADKHASIQNDSYRMENLSGASGWCAFDYNTHVNFGSGDRICYHGVMDIGRIPKYAAYFYQSQRDPSDGITLMIARRLVPSMYEDGGDLIPVYSNCDQVELFVNGVSLGRQEPDRATYPYLPHPPFHFHKRMPWPYDANTELKAVGYLDGEKVQETNLKLEGIPKYLKMIADHKELTADGGDMTRVLITANDANHHPVSLGFLAIELSLEGEGTLVGENPLVLEGGQAVVYIRATRTPGSIKLQASHPRLVDAAVEIETFPMTDKILNS